LNSQLTLLRMQAHADDLMREAREARARPRTEKRWEEPRPHRVAIRFDAIRGALRRVAAPSR
jgi:nicotinamide mononucleotide adenylyltransferase